jgi:hypothetical protein
MAYRNSPENINININIPAMFNPNLWMSNTVNEAVTVRQVSPAHNATCRGNLPAPIAPLPPEKGVCFQIGSRFMTVGSKYSFKY